MIKHKYKRVSFLLKVALLTLPLLWNGQSLAGSLQKACYDRPGVTAPNNIPSKALHVFIDQTMDLTTPMKTSLLDMVSLWGNNGERVTISRFSANIKGQYSELVFDEVGNVNPTEAYLFHLRWKDKKAILKCLDMHKKDFNKKLINVLKSTLKRTDDKLPKTNLLHSLNDFAIQLVSDRDVKDKTVLLISDGLENSDVFSFHRRNKIKLINPQKMLNTVRMKRLVPDWNGAKIYFFGLGHISDIKFYARPKIIKPLKRFWSRYFSEGNGVLDANSIGTPMLLTKSIL